MVETASILDYFYQYGYIDSKNTSDYLELFHNLVVQLINKEKYDELVDLCYDVFSFDPNIALIQKLIYTLVNLHANKSAVDLCELYLKYSKNDEIFYEIFEEFLKYENFSGAVDLCRMYIRVNPKGNLGFIYNIILGFLRNNIKNTKIFDLIEELLELDQGIKYIYTLIHSMVEIQNYDEVRKICKLILHSNCKDKLKLFTIINLILENGEVKAAWDLCKILLRFYPSSIDVLLLYGNILIKMEKYQQARNLISSTLKQLPLTTPKLKSKLLNFIGWTYIQQEDWKKATNPCIKSMKLNPRFPDSYNNLGYVYFKKGYIKKGINLIKKAIKLNSNFSQAWVNLGKVHLEMADFYEAHKACYNCLSINNQHKEGIDLYKKLSDNPDIKILSYLIPKLIHMGYRCGFDSLNETVFPNKLLKNHRYITYSKEFLNFLKEIRLAQMYLNDFISIYCWLPKCKSCENLLKLYGERTNYKNGSKTRMYRCEICGKEKREIEPLDNEKISFIKLRVILDSPSPNKEKKTLFYSKLDYEKIFITYSTLEAFKNDPKSKSSELISNLEDALLIYGEDIRKRLI